MKIAVFDSHTYDRDSIAHANLAYGHQLEFFEERLHDQTAGLAKGFDAVCPFVSCRLTKNTLQQLKDLGVRLVVLRASGYNGIDIRAAAALGIPVLTVPAYSPEAVAEHSFALLLSLVRRIHRAYNRVRDLNFSLEGLEGFNLHGRTYGLLGTGRIGLAAARIAKGFGCNLVAYDPMPNPKAANEVGFEYVSFDELVSKAEIISLHMPLSAQSHHIIDAGVVQRMRPGAVLINTSRGGLVDAAALVEGLKSGQLGGVGLDVYELEEGVFFHDLSSQPLKDDVLARLMTFPNVLITSHQGFLTREALGNIAHTTLENARAFEAGEALVNQVKLAS